MCEECSRYRPPNRSWSNMVVHDVTIIKVAELPWTVVFTLLPNINSWECIIYIIWLICIICNQQHTDKYAPIYILNRLWFMDDHNRLSVHNAEDIIVTIVSTISIWTDIEYLWKFEWVILVHLEGSSHKNKHASRNWAFLGILILYVILDILETKRLNLLRNLLKPLKEAAIVGHRTGTTIIVDERVSVLHDSVVVAGEKLFTNCFHWHETADLFENLYKSTVEKWYIYTIKLWSNIFCWN